MTVPSAGILLYRHIRDDKVNAELQVLLVHPGGPYWSRKDDGAWTLPKGEYAADEEPLQAALREFTEETGGQASAPFLPLDSITARSCMPGLRPVHSMSLRCTAMSSRSSGRRAAAK
jgi:predicted NUDIX family NTP pyrophosphohydrolase